MPMPIRPSEAGADTGTGTGMVGTVVAALLSEKLRSLNWQGPPRKSSKLTSAVPGVQSC